MQYYILIFSAVILFSLMFPVNKKYSLRFGSGAQASLAFSSVCGIVSTVVALVCAVLTEGKIEFSLFSFLIAVLVAVLCCAYTFIGFKMMSLGNMSVYTMFLMLGGMLVPYLFGVLWLDEPISAARIVGVILLVVSLVFPVIARKKEGRSSVIFLLFCVAVFLFNGAINVATKLHQVNEVYETVSSTSLTFMSNTINAVTSICAFTVVSLKNRKKEESKKFIKEFLSVKTFVIVLAIAYAICNVISYILQLISAVHLDASLMYPILTGGSVVLTALHGFIFFKEKPDKMSFVGLLLAFAATFLFLF